MIVLKSKFYGILGLLSLVVLSGCKGELSVSGANVLEAGTANGSGATAVASGQTSATFTPASGKIWNSFHVDLGADYLDTNICSGKTVFGKPGSALCGGSVWTVTTLNLDSSNVGSLSGTTFTYTAAANNAHNVLNLDMGADFTAANLCSGKSVLGVTGTTACVSGATITPAGAGDVLFGTEAWLSNGTKVTGTITTSGPTQSAVASGSENNDSVNSVTVSPTAGSLFSGFAVSLGAHFIKANICSGKTIFGRIGTSVCNSIFGDLTGSGAHRDIGTSQIALSNEVNRGTCSDNTFLTRTSCEVNSAAWTPSALPTDYRVVPDITKDDDGFSGSVVKAVRPGVPCGQNNATVEARIADCLAKNGASATWSGATKGITGEATWKLVTNYSGEVWRDERTGLLWGDTSITASWCRASGNAQAVGDGICDPADLNGYGGQDATPTSVCAEEGSLLPAIGGENWTTGVYDASKGGMGAIASGTRPSVRWRLPTKYDWQTADNDGIRFVLPNMSNNLFWSATVVSDGRDNAWNFDGSYGNLISNDSYAAVYVRCVGR